MAASAEVDCCVFILMAGVSDANYIARQFGRWKTTVENGKINNNMQLKKLGEEKWTETNKDTTINLRQGGHTWISDTAMPVGQFQVRGKLL